MSTYTKPSPGALWPRFTRAVVATCFLAATCLLCSAGVPGQIHYQGRLIVDGKPHSGLTKLTFRIFDGAEGADLLFEEMQELTVVDGFYSAYIGKVTPIPAEVFRDHDSTYLETVVGDVVLSPRERIVAVGYALSSQYAEEALVAHRLIDQPEPSATDDGGPGALHVGATVNVAFSANKNNTTQSVSALTDTKVTWQAEAYDQGAGFDLAQDRFLAPVDGYYRFNAQVYLTPSIIRTLEKHDQKLALIQLRHNGSIVAVHVTRTSGKGGFSLQISRDQYLTGGDYVEVFVRHGLSPDINLIVDGASSRTYFSGFLMIQP